MGDHHEGDGGELDQEEKVDSKFKLMKGLPTGKKSQRENKVAEKRGGGKRKVNPSPDNRSRSEWGGT